MLLDADAIAAALEALDVQLGKSGVRAELFLVGGAVLCVVHNARPATRDVDGWFVPATAVRESAAAVARERGLPEDWLNDAAKGFLPANAGFTRWREWPHLVVSVAEPRTLLAMKVAAARTERDADDIRFLARVLGLQTAAEVLVVATAYYPAEQLPVRAQLLVEELFG
ncbi:MAG: hypothetical protein FJ102_17680 [Deltaproteobacteria bacterium]|nr:hypothetical protein [Deltaproteobacteria bacterium]